MTRSRWYTLAAGFIGLVLLAGSAAAAPPAAQFAPPQKVTPFQGYGYEPAVVVDDYGNIFVTAHKENWQLVLTADVNSPTATRSMSWLWSSYDNGVTFGDPPGWTSLSLEQHQFGDEGDLAFDDAGHLYFVDTNVTDDSITRWSTTGRGQVRFDFTRPLVPALQLVDDRPWITAHGDGIVFYLGNEGDKVTYPLGAGTGSGFGPGRYTVYASYDGAQTFNSFGYTLNDSGWCRPAADHAPGSQYVYVLCTNDEGTLWSYVSADDGHSFSRYKIGSYNPLDVTTSWPTVVVAPDGSVWGLYIDGTGVDADGLPAANRLRLFHSTDHGATWSEQDITSKPGRYEYGWLAISRDGKKLGVGVYYKPDAASAWRVYGGVWKPGQVPTLTSLDENNPVTAPATSEAPADLMASYFGPEGKLSVVWTRRVFGIDGVATVARDIYFARSF